MKIDLPENVSKTKTTFLSVIGLIMGAWAVESYDAGALVNLDWPLVVVICVMAVCACFRMWVGK